MFLLYAQIYILYFYPPSVACNEDEFFTANRTSPDII